MFFSVLSLHVPVYHYDLLIYYIMEVIDASDCLLSLPLSLASLSFKCWGYRNFPSYLQDFLVLSLTQYWSSVSVVVIYVCVTYIYVSSLFPPCKFRCSKLGHQFGNRCLLKPSCWALVLFCWGRVSHSPGRPLTYYVDEQNLKLLVFLPPPVEQMCLSPRLAFYLTLCALVWRYQISWN